MNDDEYADWENHNTKTTKFLNALDKEDPLTERQKETLGFYADDDTLIERTNSFIKYFQLMHHLFDEDDRPKPSKVNQELAHVAKVLDGLSKDARAHINQCIKALYYEDADYTMRIAAAAHVSYKGFRPEKLLRLELCGRAKLLLEDYEIHCDATRDGDLVKYLKLIKNALGFDYDPYRLARDYFENEAFHNVRFPDL